MNKVTRRIGIIAPFPELGTVPSFYGLVRYLLEDGYRVDVYACQDEAFRPLSFANPGFRVFALEEKFQKGQAGWRWQFFSRWLPYLSRQCRQQSYGGLIGVDPWGLLLAGIVARVHHIPLIYWSLELFFREDLKSIYHKLLKTTECWCNRTAAFTIIQDEDRAELLIKENGIAKEKIAYLPNAPLGEAEPGKTEMLRRTLGIAENRTIILHAGSVNWWAQSQELARAALSWPEDLAMVFHLRSSPKNDYEKAFLDQIDGYHTYVSQSPLEMDQLDDLIRSCDVGIALYEAAGRKNIFTMGLSSGKIAHYLKCGVPVVTTGLPTLRKFVEGRQCGVCVDQAEEVVDAVRTIQEDYPRYSRNAVSCFREKLEPSPYLTQILQRFEDIMHGDLGHLSLQIKEV